MPAIDQKLKGVPSQGLTPTPVSAQERRPLLDPKGDSISTLRLLPGLATAPLTFSIPALAGAAAAKWYLDKGKNFATEQNKLAQIAKNLNALHALAPEEKEKCVLALFGLALHDLELGQSKQNNSGEIFSEDHSKLAVQAFDILGRFAEADAEPAVKARAPLYQGYALLAAGDTAAALKKFESLRGKIPEADAILKQSDADTLVGMNLALLDVWEVRNAEGGKIMEDEIHSVGGFVTGVVDVLTRSDKKTIQHDNAESIALENQLVLALRRRLQTGEAKTVQEALAQIQAKGPEELKAKAAVYLTAADNTIGMLVKYSAKFPTDPVLARALIENTFHYESTQGAQQTPYAIYSFLHATSEDPGIQKETAGHIKAFEGDTDFGRAILKIRQSVSLPELAMEVAVMGGCFRLGKWAQAASLARLSGNGIRAVILSRGAGFLTTGTALWAWGTAKGVMQHNPKEVLQPEKLAKSYGATLIMLGMTRGFELLGGSLAKVMMGGAETAQLTIGQKILVTSFGMGSGLVGMVASTQTNQAFKLHEKSVGGWKESVAGDVLNFLEFAVAHKLGDVASGGKLSAAAEKQQIEIMKQEWVELRTWAIDKIAKTVSGIPQKTEQALQVLALSDGFETLMGLMGEAVVPNAKADPKGGSGSGGTLLGMGPISLLGLEQVSPGVSLGIGILVGGALVAGGIALYKVLNKKSEAKMEPLAPTVENSTFIIHNLHSPKGYLPFEIEAYHLESNRVMSGVLGTADPKGTRQMGEGPIWWVTLRGHNGGFYKGYSSAHLLQSLGILAADGKTLTQQAVVIRPFRITSRVRGMEEQG